MDINELLKKVQLIELKSRRRTKQVFSGGYQSAFKGKGMAFSEVKDYQFGDDVRNIDWNVTARFDKPYVKVFEEEREISVFLIIDLSGSNNFGSKSKSKKELILETVAVLAFSAVSNNDKIGAIFVTDEVEKYIPPKKGKAHALRILRELIVFEPKSNKTHINKGLQFFTNIIKRRGICFVISDFMDENKFKQGLEIASKKHDLVALRIMDPAEKLLPKMGLISLLDTELGKKVWVNSSSRKVQLQYQRTFLDRKRRINELFRRYGIDYATLSTEEDDLLELKKLFLMRKG